MLNKLRYNALSLTVMGLGILVFGWFFYPHASIFGAGFGLFFCGLVHLGRYLYYRQPEHLPAYEAKQKEFAINMSDERKVFLRARAGQTAYQIITFLLLLLAAAGPLLSLPAWFSLTMLLLAVFSYLLGIFLYRRLCRKL